MSSWGMMPPPNTATSLAPCAFSASITAGKSVRWAPDMMERPYRVHVLLDGSRRDHLRGLVQAGVDDLEPRVAQGAGDDLGAAIVAVEAGLRDQDSQRAIYFWLMRSFSRVR